MAAWHHVSPQCRRLGACYVAGLPFYRNDVVSTLVFSAVFFSLPFAAKVLREAGHSLGERGTSSL